MNENPNAIMSYEASAIAGVNALMSIVRSMRASVFQEGTDFGVIPGTNDKPVLLLPGMEKLLRALRLTPDYHALTIIEDFDKPLFFYRYECKLIEQETGLVVGSAIGSANSHETKWRWREAKRTCPKCGQATINHDNKQASGGWYCWKKIGGCGATFTEKDESVIKQTVGRIENPDIADQVGTIDKIAQKRALASAIKQTAAVSELFSVDLEDMPGFNVQINNPDDDLVIVGQATQQKPTEPPPRPAPATQPSASSPTPAASPEAPTIAQNGAKQAAVPLFTPAKSAPHYGGDPKSDKPPFVFKLAAHVGQVMNRLNKTLGEVTGSQLDARITLVNAMYSAGDFAACQSVDDAAALVVKAIAEKAGEAT